MHKRILTNLKYLFLLALLAHLLMGASFTLQWPFSKPDLKLESLPAYIYREEKNNPLPEPPKPLSPPVEKVKDIQVSPDGIEKPAEKKTPTDASKAQTFSMGKGQENINLKLKATNQIDKPLLNLLTKATAAHLFYPKIAVDFRLTGRAIVGFILYPDGHLTDITLLQTSGAQVLDEAALAAIRGISPLKHSNDYLTKPEPMMMGIIFG